MSNTMKNFHEFLGMDAKFHVGTLAVVDDTVTWIDHVAGQLVQSSRIQDVQTVKAECWEANFKKSSTIQ